MIRAETSDFLPTNCLENYCLEAGLSMPDFQLLGAEGVVHAPIFCYKVSVGDIVAVSTGQSKKKAKHAAAHEALAQLLKRAKTELKDSPDLTLEEYKSTEEYNENVASSGELNKYTQKAAYLYLKRLEKSIAEYETPNAYNQEQINSVGKLQEVAMRNKWQPPVYETIDDEVRSGNEKIFTMICEIQVRGEILTENGQGRSKKEAKRTSALKMLNVLAKKGLFSFVEEPDNLNKRLKKLDDGYGNEFVPAKLKLDQFYAALEHDLNKELDKQLECLNSKESVDFCEKLEELACYVECKVDYIDFLPLHDELLAYSSLVNLSPFINNFNCPIVTGWGQSSVSTRESRNQAARTALELFNRIRYGEK